MFCTNCRKVHDSPIVHEILILEGVGIWCYFIPASNEENSHVDTPLLAAGSLIDKNTESEEQTSDKF